MSGGGRYAKKIMRTFFIFLSLILSLSFLITACGGSEDPPPKGNGNGNGNGNGDEPPKQVRFSTSATSNSITVTWELTPGSTGEDVVGVVGVLKALGDPEVPLTAGNACQNVPENVLTHARNGSGEASGTSGETTYMAANDADGSALVFGSLMAATSYSIAVCSVSATKIRGDGTGGTANDVIVTRLTTRSAGPPPTESMPPKQVRFSTSATSNSITVTWELTPGSTGEDVVGVVGVLKALGDPEVPLTAGNACQNVPENVLTHARNGSGEASGTSGETTYMAVNDADGSALVFGSLMAATSYSIAVCSVSAMNIRGDGTGGTANNVIVTRLTTRSVGPPPPTFPKQVTVPTPTFTPGSPLTITVTWSVTGTTGADVQGVVAALKPQTSASVASLNQTDACATTAVPAAILSHARNTTSGSPITSEMGGVTYIADNRDGASQEFMFSLSPTVDTVYSLAVCSVAAGSIRGDGNSDGDDAHAVVYGGSEGIRTTPQVPVKGDRQPYGDCYPQQYNRQLDGTQLCL